MDDPRQRPVGLHHHPDFASQVLGNRRTLTVYLPPGYDGDRDRRYPVLYLHDGQNLFDPVAAAFGVAWDAHTTADRLIRAGRVEPVILVGIDNTPDRVEEYTLYTDPGEGCGGNGRLYARFVVDEVKPFIDRRYRTRPGREHTGVAGSSLGGLVSLTIVREHHERFGLCGLLSPSLWWAGGRVLEEVEREPAWLRGVRFWVDMGTREGSLGPVRRLVRQLEAAGLVRGRDHAYHEVAGGEHNEAAWAARFDRVLLFLFRR